MNGSVFRGTVTGSLSIFTARAEQYVSEVYVHIYISSALLRGQELNEPRPNSAFVSRITAAKEKTNYLTNTTMTGDEALVDVEQL